MNGLSESEVRALIVLLGDEDEWTAGVAHDRLLEAGPGVVPQLRQAADAKDILLRGRARRLLESIRLTVLANQFRRYSYRPDRDLGLLEGAFLVAEVGYANLNREPSLAALRAIEADLRRELVKPLSAHEVVAALRHVLFEQHGFRGDSEQFYNPDNSFINRVIERRKGNPISLSILYIELAARVGLSVAAIGMPGHFIVKPEGLNDLFVDPFSGGQFLNREDCTRFLENAGYGYGDSYLRPIRVRSTIARMLVNLVQIYSQLEDHERASRLTELFNIVLRRNTGD